ncbi:HPP family protein [Paucibacter aquatile]|nr:HPP family protein [Paucibacter aquatile]WIW00264.1 HPP family protein [Paucibacter aquatile]
MAWLSAFLPAPLAIDNRERLRVVAGASLGIGLTAWLCHALAGAQPSPWLVAPLGASAVLVFAVPGSPLAQPWAVIGGNTVSALVAVLCMQLQVGPEWTAALAVGAAIAAMMALRCLHPPGGACALLVVLNGIRDPAFALQPVLLNSVLLVLCGMVYNQATKRPYPHRAAAAVPAADLDLDQVLARYNQVLDISRDELRALIEDTQLQGYQRRLADLRARDIMSTHIITVAHSWPLAQAWPMFRQHKIKAMPVVDAQGELVGIVTPADFLRSPGFDAAAVLAPGGLQVGQIMTRSVRVVSADRHLAELIPVFASSGHHHLPVIDAQQRPLGMVTQSDVVAALSGSLLRAAPPT